MTDFDPEFDKLHDQPVTIGGDKSAAAWHPHRVPAVDLDALAEKAWQREDIYSLDPGITASLKVLYLRAFETGYAEAREAK
jgi:hypothetical protein